MSAIGKSVGLLVKVTSSSVQSYIRIWERSNFHKTIHIYLSNKKSFFLRFSFFFLSLHPRAKYNLNQTWFSFPKFLQERRLILRRETVHQQKCALAPLNKSNCFRQTNFNPHDKCQALEFFLFFSPICGIVFFLFFLRSYLIFLVSPSSLQK